MFFLLNHGHFNNDKYYFYPKVLEIKAWKKKIAILPDHVTILHSVLILYQLQCTICMRVKNVMTVCNLFFLLTFLFNIVIYTGIYM